MTRTTGSLLSLHALPLMTTWIVICAGLCLTVLLPLGTFCGLYHDTTHYVLILHFSLQFLSVALSILLFLELCRSSSWYLLFTVTPVLLLSAVVILHCLLPITEPGALTHYLAVPRWWLAREAVHEIRWYEPSYHPMLLSMGYSGLLSYGLAELTAIYHFSFLLILCGITAGSVYYLTEDVELGILGFILMLGLPICIRLASAPATALGLATFCALATFLITKWSVSGKGWYHILGAALAMGLALSTGYNALIAALAMGLAFIPHSLRCGRTLLTTVWTLLCGTIVSLVTVGPWFIKNAVQTFNPIHPLFKQIFGGSVASAPLDSAIGPLQTRVSLYGETTTDILLLPFRMLLQGVDYSAQFFDGTLHPVLLLCVVPLLALRRERWIMFSYLYLLLFWVGALLWEQARIAVLAPVFFVLVLLSCCALPELNRLLNKLIDKKFRLPVYSAFGLLTLLFSTHYCWQYIQHSKAIDYLGSEQTPDQYLSQQIDVYPMIDYLNKNLPEDQGYVYLLYTGNNFYYHDKKVIAEGADSGRQLAAWLKASNNIDYLYEELATRGIGFLLMHNHKIEAKFNQFLDADQRALWNAFSTKYLEPVHSIPPYSLWRIVDPPTSTSSISRVA